MTVTKPPTQPAESGTPKLAKAGLGQLPRAKAELIARTAQGISDGKLD